MKKVTAMLATLLIVSSFTFTAGINEASSLDHDNELFEFVAEFETNGKGENGYV
ncbi:hypothetical protein JCM19047_3530 [Bacillus sp. JCM 19047]|nr:hypothetical protein JCM19047_3530 [Bacillus sp. JCM 19047]